MGEGVASLYIFYLVKYGWQAVFLNLGSIGMLTATMIFFIIREPLRKSKKQTELQETEI